MQQKGAVTKAKAYTYVSILGNAMLFMFHVQGN